MERSRPKRIYYYDHEPDGQTPPPRNTRPRFHNNHRRTDRRPPPPTSPIPAPTNPNSTSSSFTTHYRILCPDLKAIAVLGKSGAAIKALRHQTGAWIDVHPLVPGDDERIIETADTRRREPDGRPPQFSPAQEALLVIHERMVEVEVEEEEEEGEGWDRDRGRVTTRLVVPRMHVGCLMGKGGKIIEQMRIETRTHIRILPRDQDMPQCVSTTEEIVQVVGEPTAVKRAVSIISSRLKESIHRDRGPFHGRVQSVDRFPPPDEENGPYISNGQNQSDGAERSYGGFSRARNSSFSRRSAGFGFDSDANHVTAKAQSIPYEDIVFRILCPIDKVVSFTGASGSDGILEILRNDVGVDVSVYDLGHDSSEQIIIISSDEGPDDDLFPAQEALLHIQSHIVDLGAEKDMITTRLLIPARDISCLEGKDGTLSDIKRLTSADVQILPKEEFPPMLEADELVQIVGEIRAARNALVEITARLRSFLYHDNSSPKELTSPCSAANRPSGGLGMDSSSPDKVSVPEGFQGSDNINAALQNIPAAVQQLKDSGGSANESSEREESNQHGESQQSELNSSSAPVVSTKTLEIVVPEHAVRSLRSGSKLTLIGGMSGATLHFLEDRPDSTEQVIQISGSPEQAERAHSLLQGFILSTLDDGV